MTTICLKLFVTGQTTSAKRARAALAYLETLLIAERGPGAVVSEIIDVLTTPEIAARDDIFATPTIVRMSPGPSVRVFGDLSSAKQLMASLGLAAEAAATDPRIGDSLIAAPLIAERAVTGEDAGSWRATPINSGISLSPAAVPD